MTQEAADKYASDVKEGGAIIIDSGFVNNLPKGNFKVYKYPITQTAEEVIGKKLVANIIALGIIEKVSKIISEKAMINAIRARVPKGTEEINIKAFNQGQKLV